MSIQDKLLNCIEEDLNRDMNNSFNEYVDNFKKAWNILNTY